MEEEQIEEKEPTGEIQSKIAVDANGEYKQVTVETYEETVTYVIYTTEGFFMRVRVEAFSSWQEKAEKMLESTDKSGNRLHTKKDVENWKLSRIYNTIKADPSIKPTGKQFLDFADKMYDVAFADDSPPEGIEESTEVKVYVVYETYQFKLRALKESFEKFLKKMAEKEERSPGDMQLKEKKNLYVQKGMKLTGRSLAGGQFYANFRELHKEIFGESSN